MARNPSSTTQPGPATVHPYPPNISDPPAMSPLFSSIEGLICIGATIICIIFAVVLFAIDITCFPMSEFPYFHISAAPVAPLNSTSTASTASWNLTLQIKNPNAKYKIHYGEFLVSVFYSGDDIEFIGTKFPPFVQAKKNVTLLNAELSISSRDVGSSVLRRIVSDQDHGLLGLWVRVTVKIEVDNDEKVLVMVSCYGVEIRFESGSNGLGLLSGLPIECMIEGVA